MLLSVHSRLILLGLSLKAEGGLTTLRLVREFQAAIGWTEAELKALDFQQADGRITWTATHEDGKPTVPPKEVEVGPELKKAVAGWFKPADEAGKLSLEMLPIYEQFLEE